MIHSTAIIHPHARLDSTVSVGPFAVIDEDVTLGPGCVVGPHAYLTGVTTAGARNKFHSGSVVGGTPQDLKYKGDKTNLRIGDDNVFREHVTVNVSSGERPTTIGAKNLFMAGAHVAHDVLVGSNCVVANAVQLAGHVIVEDWVTFGGLSGVAQHLRVGQSAFVAAGAMCERDVPPFVIVQGDRARVRALNVVGLERRGVSADSITRLKKAFARTFVRRAPSAGFDDAVRALDRTDPFVDAYARALSGV